MTNTIITSKGELDIEAIMTVLPHRYPFLLIDRVKHFEVKKSLTAIKNVTVNEQVFGGHFPEKPVFPGVLIIEAMAQAAGVLSIISHQELGYNEENMRYIYLFAGIDKARFTRMVHPGDQMILDIQVEKYRKGFAKFSATAQVDSKIACSASLTSIRHELGYAK